MCAAFACSTCVRRPAARRCNWRPPGADVVALDASDTRLDRLRENLARTGFAPRSSSPTRWSTRALRRHPSRRALHGHRHDPPSPRSALREVGRETEELTRLQMRLLDHALGLLKPGGRLVFCTCSLLAVEGEYQVKAALKRHEGPSRCPPIPVTLGGDPDWASPEGGLRLWPGMWADRGGIDGFYMACLTHGAAPKHE
jgi:16S rRNA (cytosine967-C5)-methyltransferase